MKISFEDISIESLTICPTERTLIDSIEKKHLRAS